jgi:hypothetical protein
VIWTGGGLLAIGSSGAQIESLCVPTSTGLPN